MRILLVSHLFPPSHSAGVEVFTSELAQGLAAIGHEVCVLHTNKRVGRSDLQMLRRTYRGLPVFEIVNNLFHTEFEQTWNHPKIDAFFEEALLEFKPDIVHFHHLMYLSVGCVGLAKRHAQGVLFTPHDFYLECGSMGQLVHTDGQVCQTVDTARCGTCLPNVAWSQGTWQRRVGKTLGVVHSLTRVNLGPLARRVAEAASGTDGAGVESDPEQTIPASETIPDALARRFKILAEERRTGLLEAVIENVDRFLCPSQFLADRMSRFGLPKERTFLCPTGVDLKEFQGAQATRGGGRVRAAGTPIQITFIGTMIPVKGPHLLMEAWGKVPAELRSCGELSLWGPLDHAPAFVGRLRERASDLLVEVGGRLSRAKVASKLAETDLFVMPSMWYENRPLILHEALALGVPCLVSDQGGMAELIEPDRDGWHFAMGSSVSLAERLARVLADPKLLDGLQPKSPDLCTWEQAAERFEAHYKEVIQ